MSAQELYNRLAVDAKINEIEKQTKHRCNITAVPLHCQKITTIY